MLRLKRKMMTGGKILLVDDDPGFLTALAKLLAKNGYDVTSTISAADALAQIKGQKKEFDLVITDLSMPLINGMTVLTAVKTAFPDMEVIVITAFYDQLTRTNARREGAYAFIDKPLNGAEFLGVVGRALEARLQSIAQHRDPPMGGSRGRARDDFMLQKRWKAESQRGSQSLKPQSYDR